MHIGPISKVVTHTGGGGTRVSGSFFPGALGGEHSRARGGGKNKLLVLFAGGPHQQNDITTPCGVLAHPQSPTVHGRDRRGQGKLNQNPAQPPELWFPQIVDHLIKGPTHPQKLVTVFLSPAGWALFTKGPPPARPGARGSGPVKTGIGTCLGDGQWAPPNKPIN